MSSTNKLTPKQALNKAYLKEKVTRAGIEVFKKNLVDFIHAIDEKESEEHVKNLVTKFLYDTYYHGKNQINTKGRIDLAIYEDKKPVVIIEAKRPNSPDMVNVKNLNAKAMHELILYYLRERIDEGNIDIKYLIATNMYEWFVFDASVFDKVFYKNTELTKDYNDWKNKRKASPTTDSFYNDIAFKFLKSLKDEIPFTWFDLRKVEKVAANNDPKDDTKLIDLFKILSPAHLLKQPFANDSNSLDTKFYSELLHLIGLEEKKDKGKKIIQRREKPDAGSLLENVINTLIAEDRLSALPGNGAEFGEKKEDRLFNVGLELCITWINRILFLKLLEGQLLNYHAGEKRFRFLDFKTIPDYDELNKLFFQVLARKQEERTDTTRDKFQHVPYLNSSLFDISPLEADAIRINSLDNGLKLKISSGTVLKTENGKKREGELPMLQYLFEFLDAYDFSSEGKEEIQEENKALINASVLGLIFEKINGYKDGSFFTPGFITMYMCRETIRRAVVQKFNEAKDLKIESFEGLYNQIKDVKEANDIINSLKICDPAVGSGHFLVSALNEIIAIKSELGILSDRQGKVLRDYAVEVINDELIISIDKHELFEYKPSNKESQRVQEALFHEKQTIIENCLFGVDINPNSVKICRLRLWIELLKNAYYTEASKYTQLETLPNIDINIKQGNSLISRFALDADLSKALKSIKYSVEDYRSFVNSYKNATDKEEKRGFEKLIEQIKGDFKTEIAKYSDPDKKKLQGLNEEMFQKYQSGQLYDQKLSDKQRKDRAKLESDINKLTAKVQAKISDPIFRDAFEWRFEFPEVLTKNGRFGGFDVVIGNPPYIRQEEFSDIKEYLKQNFRTYTGTSDLFVYFIELGLERLSANGQFIFIVPNKWMKAGYGKLIRNYLKGYKINSILDFGDLPVFEEATTYPCILSVSKSKPLLEISTALIETLDFQVDLEDYINSKKTSIEVTSLKDDGWTLSNSNGQKILEKLKTTKQTLSDYTEGKLFRGILTGLNEAFIITEEIKDHLIASDKKSEEMIKPFLAGKDIKAFVSPEVKQWVILFPKGFTIKRNLPKGNSLSLSEPPPRYGEMPYDDAWNWLQKNYQAIAKYLTPFRRQAQKRTDKGDYWWELRACDYYDAFEQMKIVWPETSLDNQFCYVEPGVYLNKTSFFIPRKDDFLLGLLNSNLAKFYLGSIVSKMRGGYFSMSKAYVETLPVAYNKQISEDIAKIVSQILSIKKKDASSNIRELEVKIDQLVYQLYGLTEEEIKIVEGN